MSGFWYFCKKFNFYINHSKKVIHSFHRWGVAGGEKWIIMLIKWIKVENHNFITIMLIGEYKHTIDEKNRVSLPVKFRKEMGKKVVITPGLDNCLFVFSLNEWQKIANKLSQGSMLQADNRSFNRFMFGGAGEIDIDALGRILIPDFLKERTNLKNKIVIIGIQNRLEIWNEKTWTDYKQVVERQADTLAEKLGQVGVL